MARMARMASLVNRFSKLRKIWANSIYNGGIAKWVRNLRRRNRIELNRGVSHPSNGLMDLSLAESAFVPDSAAIDED
jgi:hypothetical protein